MWYVRTYVHEIVANLSSSLRTADDGWIAKRTQLSTHATQGLCTGQSLPAPDPRLDLSTAAHRYFNFVWEGKSLLEYCFERAERSFSPFPLPPRAGSNVGRAAVVILYQLLVKPSVPCHSAIFLPKTTPTRVTYANVTRIIYI